MRKLMIRIAIQGIVLLLCAIPALAGQARDNTGCGLGSLLWDGKADNSVMSQSLQATTNGTFGNQTFGITSGTLGCDQPSKVASNDQLNEFTARNMDMLAKDIAVGHGESLDTLAELMDVPVYERPAFYASLQGNFNSIFITGQENSAQMLDRIASISY